MSSRPTPSPPVRALLKLARTDRPAARSELEKLSLDERVALVCESPVARRPDILDLLPDRERVIARLPEAELCFTVKQVGLADAGPLLEGASDEQIVACLDLDAWDGYVPDRERLGHWIEAIADAGEKTLLRGARALDPESLVLFLKDRIEVFLKPSGDDGWEPPLGAQTLEGQFYFRALREGDDLARVGELLHVLFAQDYWLYYRMMQGVIWELQGETEEWALRWRTGRLMDLGFPPREEAIAIYAYVRPEDRAKLPEAEPRAAAFDVGSWHLPVWMPQLPVEADARHLLFRAAAKLPEAERRSFFYAFLGLANTVAVADRLPLGDAESIPAAIDKAAALASAGLECIANANPPLDPTEILRRTPLERLFRVGASLARDVPDAGAQTA
ncbi:MAG: hypothetical protein JSU66_01870 [Deltaproteobacteria bacterium]|nr:MAG: hypothetical protein JSU66_01870 [Deltaproteobacteria bacterium]